MLILTELNSLSTITKYAQLVFVGYFYKRGLDAPDYRSCSYLSDSVL
jgi:hypothetical protein